MTTKEYQMKQQSLVNTGDISPENSLGQTTGEKDSEKDGFGGLYKIYLQEHTVSICTNPSLWSFPLLPQQTCVAYTFMHSMTL